MKEIKDAKFIKSSANWKDCPPANHKEVAFIGRSNVGKSSLINMLAQRKAMAKISSKPGKTRLINHFLIDDAWYLVDLPGYGWANVSKSEQGKWESMVHEYLLNRENLTMVFVLADSRHEPQSLDVNMVNWLGTHNLPVTIIFTKADKSGNNLSATNMRKFRAVLKKSWEELPPMFLSASETKKGREEILSFISQYCV